MVELEQQLERTGILEATRVAHFLQKVNNLMKIIKNKIVVNFNI